MRGPVPGFSIRAYGSSLSLVLIERYSARARGVVGWGLEKPGILRGAWPRGTSRARGGGLMAHAHRESCARARPSAWVLNSRCVAARDKSRPWQLAIARAHQENCARARGVAGRGLEKPGILCGAWPHGTSCARGGGLMARAYRESCVRARGVAGQGLEGLSH